MTCEDGLSMLFIAGMCVGALLMLAHLGLNVGERDAMTRYDEPVKVCFELPNCDDNELRCMVVLRAAVEHFIKYDALSEEGARRAATWLAARLAAQRDV